MFSTIRWCQYTSAAALLGLACSSSSSTPSKTADDSTAASSGSSTAAGEVQTGPEVASTGTGAHAANTHPSASAGSAPAQGQGSGPAARSEGTGASGDIRASDRSPVAGRDDATPALDDSRIVAITNIANQGEVEQGRLARERAKDPRVRDFAAMMVEHHTQALRDGEKLKIEPEPGADALNMQREGKQRLDDLRDKKGAEFDRAYIALQVEEHRRLLDKINRELMPAAKDKAVTGYLEEIRPRVESHLAQAERLQQELSTSSKSDKRDSDKRDSDSRAESRTTISNERGSNVRVSDPK